MRKFILIAFLLGASASFADQAETVRADFDGCHIMSVSVLSNPDSVSRERLEPGKISAIIKCKGGEIFGVVTGDQDLKALLIAGKNGNSLIEFTSLPEKGSDTRRQILKSLSLD